MSLEDPAFRRVYGYNARIISSTDDAFIVNSLKKSGVEDWPTIFSLVWGDGMANGTAFPEAIREIVGTIAREEERKEESYDLVEKKLHSIIIDLLYVMYEKQVNDTVERVKEQTKLYK